MFERYYLKKGWKRYTQKSYERAIKLARKVKSGDTEMLIEAKRLEGLSYYKMRVYDLAIFAMEKAIHLGNYKNDWFNMAMCYAKKNQVEKANKAFQNIYMAKTLSGYMHQLSIPEMLFQFARTAFEKKGYDIAFKRLVELKQMYIGANTSDTEELKRKGLPSLNAYLILVKKVLKATNHPDPERWLSELPK